MIYGKTSVQYMFDTGQHGAHLVHSWYDLRTLDKLFQLLNIKVTDTNAPRDNRLEPLRSISMRYESGTYFTSPSAWNFSNSDHVAPTSGRRTGLWMRYKSTASTPIYIPVTIENVMQIFALPERTLLRLFFRPSLAMPIPEYFVVMKSSDRERPLSFIAVPTYCSVW